MVLRALAVTALLQAGGVTPGASCEPTSRHASSLPPPPRPAHLALAASLPALARAIVIAHTERCGRMIRDGAAGALPLTGCTDETRPPITR